MNYRQTRIFVPPLVPFDKSFWVETLLGHVVKPLVEKRGGLEWFWFSRYGAPRSDSGDCDITQIPESFAWDDGLYRSLRFRYCLSDNSQSSFEADAGGRITIVGCKISDFRDFPHLDDLANRRFLGGDFTEARRQERAELLARFLCATGCLMLHALTGPDAQGSFQLETNQDQHQNPHGNTFESIHHLFCNITDVPLRVLVSQQAIGTDWSPPQPPVAAVRVRF
jgi:hypothetical protein